MKKDGIFLSRKNLCIISFLLSLGAFTWSLLVFEQKIETLGTDKEWKFYASLAGFIIISSMLFLSIISLAIVLIRTLLKTHFENLKRRFFSDTSLCRGRR